MEEIKHNCIIYYLSKAIYCKTFMKPSQKQLINCKNILYQ